jgi:Kef-type K+ transport system membrane component KefB
VIKLKNWISSTFGSTPAEDAGAQEHARNLAVAALLPVSVQLLAGYADAAWLGAIILAVLAAGIVYARGRLAGRPHREATAVLRLHAAGSWAAAAIAAAVAAAEADTVVAALAPALAVASLASAPALAGRGQPAGCGTPDPCAARARLYVHASVSAPGCRA